MDTKSTFYKKSGDSIGYTQIELEIAIDYNNAVVVRTGILGGKHNEERISYTVAEAAYDHYLELRKKHRAEDHYRPWTAEIKITMDLTPQRRCLSDKEFKEFVESISHVIESYLYETVNGQVSRGMKKVKGNLYSIQAYLIDKEMAINQLREKLRDLTDNTQVSITDAQEHIYTHFPSFTGTKDLEVEIWTEDYGFIFVTLTLGDQVYETRFSDVWDPTEDLRRWLEAICIGVEECSFTIQNEGQDTKFNYMRRGQDEGVFYAGRKWDGMKMVEHVNSHQFVNTLYTAYSSFLDPRTFTDRKNWGDDLHVKFKSQLIENFIGNYKNTLSP